MENDTCPVCYTPLVRASGNPQARILLVGEYPGIEEKRKGFAFAGETGRILERELARVGMPSSMCWLTNLWRHEPNKNKDCYNRFVNELLHEMEKFPAVFLMGSDLVQLFQEGDVSSWCGMDADSLLIPKSVKVCIYSPNPAIVTHGAVGELRFALGRFKHRVKELGI